jgi:UDP-N-acetylmuramate dehydrogenase
MPFLSNISLKPYNSFRVDALARHFGRFASIGELQELLLETKGHPVLLLGGGSNILFTRNYEGYVLKNELRGIELVREDEEYYYVKAAAGENWHAFVQYCIAHNYAGLENLSLIPGNVGASPMQNIGAYGVEIKDVFEELEAWHLHDQCIQQFSHADCRFGYRESVFKNKYKNQFAILSVCFRLRKHPVYHIHYGAVEQELEKMGVEELSIRAVADAVIHIRQSKLPDPALIGNAGSFFKNPIVTDQQFTELKKNHPDIPGYPAPNGQTKLAAGWLIEQAGWKGYRKGDAGCYDKQALVLVNYGQASGENILSLSSEIIGSVSDRFGVVLEREVNIL